MAPATVITLRAGAEVEDLEEELELEPPQGLSFFTAAHAVEDILDRRAWEDFERADAAVCSRVWRIYLRESVERGFAPDTSTRIEAPRAELAPNTAEDAMPEEAKQPKRPGAMLEIVVKAFRAYETKHGSPPTARELFDSLGEETAVSVNNVQVTMARAERKGLIERGARGRTPRPSAVAVASPTVAPPRAKPAPAKPFRTVPIKPQRSIDPGDDVILASLIARRDHHATKANALTAAIEALGGPATVVWSEGSSPRPSARGGRS